MKVIKDKMSNKGVLTEKGPTENGHSLGLFIIFFLGSFFYTLSTAYDSTPLRLAYSVCLYGSILLMLKVYVSPANRIKLKFDRKYANYFLVLLLFTIWNITQDLGNPNFSAVTLVNHPRAIAMLVPVLGFIVGYNTINLKTIEKAIYVLTIAFCLYAIYVWKNPPFAPKIFTTFVLPFAVFNLTNGRYKFLTVLVLILAAWHSLVVDYRTLLLKVVFFAGLFVSLNLFKRSNILKFCVVIVAMIGVYIFLTDLTGFLQMFVSKTHFNEAISSDTRTFLYTEVYEDLTATQQFIGKGFLGTYFSQVFLGFQRLAEHADSDSYNRFTVEVGALQLILKGGYLLLTIYLAPLIYTCWKGLSITDKSLKLEFNLCILLLTELIIFLFENIVAYHIHFFLLFFFAGYVYKKLKERSLQEQALKPVRTKRHFDTES